MNFYGFDFMAKIMNITAILSLLSTVICTLLHIKTENDILLTLAITFGTIFYHFCMRLLVGASINALLHNKVDYSKKWFNVGKTEVSLYNKIKVKHWKGKMPTYNKSLFDSNENSWSDIAKATCQSEIVHETIIVFSFLPIFSAVWFGSLFVFVITSVLAACFDLAFVVMQRYNRPRIIKLINKYEKGVGLNEKSI